MADDSVAEDGAGGTDKPPAGGVDAPVVHPEPEASAEAPVPVIAPPHMADAPPVPAPEPLVSGELPAPIAPSRKADALSVGASALGHLLVVLLIFGSLASAQKPPEAIPVKLIPADQAPPTPPKPPKPPEPKKDKQAKQDKTVAPPEKLPEPPQKQAAAPQPKPPPQPPHQTEAKPPPAQQEKPAPATQPPANTADAGKEPPAGKPAPAPPKAAEGAAKTPSWQDIAASLGMADYGRKTTVPEKLLTELRDQAKRCWTIPTGWSDPHQVTVVLRFQLEKNGKLAGDPAVVEFPATPIGAAAAKSAMDAVKRCGPYHLPPADYAQWKDIQLRLAP